jgi:glutathione synthase/RimK-type ligase-like ATP-grasp enzyme
MQARSNATVTHVLKVGCIVEKRYLAQAMPDAVIRVLAARGHYVDRLCPQGCHFESDTGVLRGEGEGEGEDGAEYDLNAYDVILSRNRNALGLAMLAYADAAGILAINTHTATRQLRNKAKMGVALSQAGVPCAPTILADDIAALSRLHGDWFPLILKATYGDNSQGLRLVRRPNDLGDIYWRDGLVLAQRYLPNDGFDLKLYVCGEVVFAVRKPSPFNGDPRAAPQHVPVDTTMTNLALRCGHIFGLEIYGVDAIETEHGLAVIEVNEFPNFTGVPDAGELIADYVLARTR